MCDVCKMRLYFLCGLFAVHMISYWVTALLSVFLWPRDIPSKCVRVVLRNQIGYTAWPALFVSGMYTPPLPEDDGWWIRAMWQLVACVVLTDIFFYPLHRLMHTKWMYARFHKIHHEFKDPIGAAALYSGRLEHALVNVLPPMLAPAVVGCDETVFLVWTCVATVNTVIAHAEEEGQHTVHHGTFLRNYGVGLMLMDRVFGTLAK